MVGPELIAYLQWLIYSALFKSPDQGARRDEHKKYYDTWVVSFKARRGAYRKKLLKELQKWYHMHPPGMTKGRGRSKPLRCRVKHQRPFQWMKGFFWNLDPTTREVVLWRCRARSGCRARARSGGRRCTVNPCYC